MNIEEILTKVANGEQIKLSRNDLSPEDYKLVTEMMKPNLVQKGANLFTGKLNRIPGYGEYDSNLANARIQEAEFGPSKGKAPLTPEEMKAATAAKNYNAATTDEEKIDLLKIMDPEAAKTLAYDPFNNPYVVKGDKKLYLNRPGVSTQDLKEIGFQAAGSPEAVAAMAPLARAAQPGVSLLERMLIGAGYGAGTSLASDNAAIRGGSKQGYNMGEAIANALAGGSGEILAPVISKIGTPLYNILKGGKFFNPAGELKPNGIQLLMKAGIDWNTISAETKANIKAMVERAANPEDLVRQMAAQDLPAGPIRLSEAQSKGDFGKYLDEDLLRKGSFGEEAAGKMKAFDELQAKDIRSNAGAIADTLAPGANRQMSWGQGGNSVVRALQEQKLAAKKTVDEAFKGAREIGDQAYFPSLDRLKADLLNDEQISPVLNPKLIKNNQVFKDAWEDFQDTFGRAEGAGATDNSVTVKSSFDFLKRLNALSRDNPTNFALRELKRKVQKGLSDDALVGTIVGDPNSVESFLKANKLFREYAGTYKSSDIVGDLTHQEYNPKTGRQEFSVDPVDGSKLILGASRLGLIGKTGMKQTMETLKKQLPADSWNSLREEVFLRSMGWSERDFTGKGLVKSAAEMRKALTDFKKQSPELYNTLFEKKEQALLDRFTTAYEKATLAPPNKSSSGSPTTHLAMRAAQQLLPTLGPKLRGVFSVLAKPLALKTYQAGVGAGKTAQAVGKDLTGAGMDILQKVPLLSGAAAPLLGPSSVKSISGLLERYSPFDQ